MESRYNKDYKITQEQLAYLVGRVEILKKTVEEICKEKIS
jgi:uncharacterized protein